jgi:hypothetical protein
MEEPKKRKVRDVRTGEFAFDNNFDRMCVCGHTLGVHVHGGWDCGLNPPITLKQKGARAKNSGRAEPRNTRQPASDCSLVAKEMVGQLALTLS